MAHATILNVLPNVQHGIGEGLRLAHGLAQHMQHQAQGGLPPYAWQFAEFSNGFLQKNRRVCFHGLEINAESDLETDGAIIRVVLETLLIIDARLDGYRATDEVGVAHLHTRHDIVVAVEAMDKLAVGSQEDAVLHNVIAAANACREQVAGIALPLVVVGCLAEDHEVVVDHVTGLGLHAQAQVANAAIVEVQTGERRSHIRLILFKLRTRCNRDKECSQ